jgi:ABC-type multidrug transport system fused ATPase/permease subunit
MNRAAIARDSELLAERATERSTLELAGDDPLVGTWVLWPGSNGRVASFAKHAQERQVIATPHKSVRLWNSANVSELDRNESPSFERGWRWPLSYRSIEGLAVFVDALIIVFTSVLADAGYRLATAALPTEITIHVGMAAVVAALLTCLLRERGLYKPTALMNWRVQVRAVTIIWIGVFVFLAGCAFALKIGDTFSSVTIASFAAFGLCCLIAQRALWRSILENGLASGKLAGRTIVLISDSQPASNLQQALLRQGFRVRRHFVVPADCSHPSHERPLFRGYFLRAPLQCR